MLSIYECVIAISIGITNIKHQLIPVHVIASSNELKVKLERKYIYLHNRCKPSINQSISAHNQSIKNVRPVLKISVCELKRFIFLTDILKDSSGALSLFGEGMYGRGDGLVVQMQNLR